ncbi:hypothetical protein [Halorubrum sp. Atlit-26R]|jgi:hypothetical protein|uniref:hypothetical protein n=1 Tax=Halorubrum sp. Atlit-26R TaxID=2282128 RepID=UPI000EF1CB4A|nr:hypothetical protein [Halorubrum sp. Atlit-26R]RLM68540.1 hypothetical protein DVK07_10485 [Halorubrum sp. Atlit-26R]
MTLPYTIPATYRAKCAPDLDAVAPTPSRWDRHTSEQDVLAIGRGAPVEYIGQYVFSDGSEKHAITVAYLREESDLHWDLSWVCSDEEITGTHLRGVTQCHYETHDAMMDALRDYMAGIEEHAPSPHYNVDAVVPARSPAADPSR